MKNQSHSNFIIRSSLALIMAAAVWAPLQAQSPTQAPEKPMMGGKMMGSQATVAESQQAMMEHHKTMMADMKQQDAEIAAKVVQMNSAPADKKMELMAAIITRMVEQRTVMNSRMGMMQGEMMKCSMQDMSMGANNPAQQPMMKGMDGKMEDAKK